MKLEDLTGAVLSNYIALHYNEQLKYTKFYKRELKNKLNIAIKELQRIESTEFDKVFNVDEETTHNVSSNMINFIDQIVKLGFHNHIVLSNIILAHKKDPKSIEGIATKILNKR